MAGNNSENREVSSYISFIVVARNDDYGGNFLHRFQIFLNVLFKLWKKYSLNAELIVVEWNPPLNEKKLAEALFWPKDLKPGQVRFIEIANEIHKKLPNSDKMPIFEYIGKNVGARRARGEYILTTNPDLIFNEEFIKFFSEKKLLANCFYRANRYDLEKVVPFNASVEEQLDFCKKNWVAASKVHGIFLRNWLASDYQSLRFSALDFISHLMRKLNNDPRAKIHTKGAGDFFLAAKAQWYKLRGFPEFKTHGHTDSYMCFLAASSGLPQIILNNEKRIYHQYHSRLESSNRPLTDYQLCKKNIKQMMKEKRPSIFNDLNWGLADKHLRDYYI